MCGTHCLVCLEVSVSTSQDSSVRAMELVCVVDSAVVKLFVGVDSKIFIRLVSSPLTSVGVLCGCKNRDNSLLCVIPIEVE